MKKNMTRCLALMAVLCLCVGTAFAAQGRVSGYVRAGSDNGVYWGSDGTLHTVFRTGCRAYTEERTAQAADVVNLYAKASVVNRHNGVVYTYDEIVDHNVTSTSVFSGYFERKDEESSVDIALRGLHRARYTDDTTSEFNAAELQGSVGGGARSADNGMTEAAEGEWFGCGEEFEHETFALMTEQFGIDLTGYQYIADGELGYLQRQDELSPELSPLFSIMTDIFAAAKTGDYLPFRIFYKDTSAYTVERLADGGYRLTEYSLVPDTAEGYSADPDRFHHDYSVVDVVIESERS